MIAAVIMHSYRRLIIVFMPWLDDFASARLSCIVYSQIREVYHVGIEIRLRLVLLLVTMIIVSTTFITTEMWSVIVRHNVLDLSSGGEKSQQRCVLCTMPACEPGSTARLILLYICMLLSFLFNISHYHNKLMLQQLRDKPIVS